MAYSNWGAFVYRDGKRMRDHEDVPPFGADAELGVGSGARIFVNILKNREKYQTEQGGPWYEHCHHAVLGAGRIKLCGYKSHPEIYRVADDGTIERLELEKFRLPGPLPIDVTGHDEWSWYESNGIAGELDGYKFTATPQDDPEAVELQLTEPDGTVWTARCGYCIGAGHEDDPDGDE